jgi:hypothetical protein
MLQLRPARWQRQPVVQVALRLRLRLRQQQHLEAPVQAAQRRLRLRLRLRPVAATLLRPQARCRLPWVVQEVLRRRQLQRRLPHEAVPILAAWRQHLRRRLRRPAVATRSVLHRA